MWWPKTERQAELVALAGRLADRFAERAPQHDREGSFPHENFADLAASGYLALTIPREFGGGGASILEATLAQARLSEGDGSTGLGMSMHLSIMGRLGWAVVAGRRRRPRSQPTARSPSPGARHSPPWRLPCGSSPSPPRSRAKRAKRPDNSCSKPACPGCALRRPGTQW